MRLIKIKVVPNAKKNKVVEEGEGLKVYLTAPPVKGKANKALIKLLAEFFKVKKSQIKIARGERSKEKVVEVNLKN